MTKLLTTSAIIASTLLVGTACAASTPVQEPEEVAASVEPVEVVMDIEKVWTCPDCSPNEKFVLKELQDRTNITDRNALATIMGNIRSESNFYANICEGGARVPYERCYSGGFGLIQWTTLNRYNGLGNFAYKYNCNPTSLDCQVRYMINENQFQNEIPCWEKGGQSIGYYMRSAYRWLGWGIKGYREQYAYDYSKRMVLA